ncbi:thymidylate kinase [Actinomadura harenae]|uniref:Thymidylate kinase n=1 Tax=Actinomadura harenae TaxID=2483351 RepID=A0A3M2LND1_9ACTN|nr:thymidylate kinase [Actinomadura harenae]RMI38636.1 thymidylate kinase [Actinomadura harenae]
MSIEGINGVGKTAAARTTAATLGTRCLLLDELTDQAVDPLTERVIAALSADGDPFLRTGHPVVETLAFAALEVRKVERLAGRDLTGVAVILEDRGVDSVAACQAAILCSSLPERPPSSDGPAVIQGQGWPGEDDTLHSRATGDVAERVLASLRPWARIPDATILLTGDPEVCAKRFTDRAGYPPLPASDVRILQHIETTYRQVAARDSDRYRVVDTAGLTPGQTATAVCDTVTTLLDRQVRHAR